MSERKTPLMSAGGGGAGGGGGPPPGGVVRTHIQSIEDGKFGQTGHDGGHIAEVEPSSGSKWQPPVPPYAPCGCCPVTQSTAYWLLAIGFLVFALIAVIIPLVVHGAIKQGISDRLVITGPNSAGYAAWSDSRNIESGKTIFKAHVWHIVNPLEVLKGERPYLQQKGPYVYDKIQRNFDVTFINKTFIKYKSYTYYVFNKELSNGLDDSEFVTSLNIPFQAVKQNGGDIALLVYYSGPDVLHPTHTDEWRLFANKTARDHVFGYVDDVLTQIHSAIADISAFYPGLQPNLTSIEDAEHNTTFDMVYSGESDESKVQQYYEWRGSREIQGCNRASCPPAKPIPMWGPENSALPEASIGRQFSPGVEPGSCVDTFVPQTFRKFKLCNKNSETVTIEGIKLLRFTLDPSIYQNASQNPENAKWSQFGPSGLSNVTNAQRGMPVFMTKAHFLDCDPSVYSYFDGDIKPEFLKHDTLVHVQPDLGTTMNGQKRIQVNWHIGPMPAWGWFPNIRPTYWPVAWFEESGTISPYLKDKFNGSIVMGQMIARIAAWGGGFLALLCIAFAYYINHDRKQYAIKYEGGGAEGHGLTSPAV